MNARLTPAERFIARLLPGNDDMTFTARTAILGVPTEHGIVARPRFMGMPVVHNSAMPPWLVGIGYPGQRFTFIDLRSRPRTDDMSQMIDDLRRSGGMPK